MKKHGRKIAILGAGRVGAAVAHRLAAERLCDQLVLADMDLKKSLAEAADLQDSVHVSGGRLRVCSGSYYDCADASLCILAVAARIDARLPRLEQMDQAAAVLGRVVPSLMATGFDGILLVLSHPVELMTWLAQQLSDLPEQKVLGLGTVLDMARLRGHLAAALGVETGAIQIPVLGIHDGDQVIPWTQATLDGRAFSEILREKPDRMSGVDFAAISNTIADITFQLRQTKGAASFGAAAATAAVARAILEDTGEVLPVCAMPHGEYGAEDVYVCMPSVLGAEGVRSVVEVPLTGPERERFSKIVRDLRQCMAELS